MSKIKRKLDLDKKLRILREGETNGVEVTCRNYQIARSLFYNWKKRFNRRDKDLSGHCDPQKKNVLI